MSSIRLKMPSIKLIIFYLPSPQKRFLIGSNKLGAASTQNFLGCLIHMATKCYWLSHNTTSYFSNLPLPTIISFTWPTNHFLCWQQSGFLALCPQALSPNCSSLSGTPTLTRLSITSSLSSPISALPVRTCDFLFQNKQFTFSPVCSFPLSWVIVLIFSSTFYSIIYPLWFLHFHSCNNHWYFPLHLQMFLDFKTKQNKTRNKLPLTILVVTQALFFITEFL